MLGIGSGEEDLSAAGFIALTKLNSRNVGNRVGVGKNYNAVVRQGFGNRVLINVEVKALVFGLSIRLNLNELNLPTLAKGIAKYEKCRSKEVVELLFFRRLLSKIRLPRFLPSGLFRHHLLKSL